MHRKKYRAKSNFWLKRELAWRLIRKEKYGWTDRDKEIIELLNALYRRGQST